MWERKEEGKSENVKLEWKIKTLLECSGSPACGFFHTRNPGISFSKCFPNCQFARSDPHWMSGKEAGFHIKSFVINVMKLVAAMIMKTYADKYEPFFFL